MKLGLKLKLKLNAMSGTAIAVLFISIGFLISPLVYPKIHYGQLGKQTFAAQMIESTARGELTYGVFPTRHFVESYQEKLIPWAEEVPLYSFMSAGLVRAFGFSPIIAGKVLSFIAFALIILGFAQIAKTMQKSVWIFVILASIYPAFRLYSVEVMPDLCMTAALVWMIEATLAERFGRAALFLLVASVFKYYAVFTGFGVGLYFLYRRNFRAGVYLGLAVIPCIAYVGWFIHLGIPNPITEYRAADGHGHLSSLTNIFVLRNWVRVGLWWFVKNASIPGTLLSMVGACVIARQDQKHIPFFISLWIGLILFPALFISSFYVHDYYGLQGSLGLALFAAVGLTAVFEWKTWAGYASIAILMGFSLVMVRFMVTPDLDYDRIEAADETLHLPKDEFIISISGVSKPVISYHVHQNAYVIGMDEFNTEPAQKRVADPSIRVAFIHGFKSFAAMLPPIEAKFSEQGYHRVKLDLALDQYTFEVWSK